METRVTVKRRRGTEVTGMPLDQAAPVSRDRRAVRRAQPPPVRTFRSWLFTVLLLGLIGLLAGIMLGGLIST